jgi:hypothetical protein
MARTQWTKFYLHHNPAGPANNEPGGIVSPEPPSGPEEPDTYSVDKVDHWNPVPPEYVIYTTEPLEKDLTVQGPLSMTIYGSAETAHTCTWAWFVKVGEVTPDGKYNEFVFGNLKAAFREVDKSRSRPGQPWHPFQEPVYLEPSKIYEFEIEIRPVFYTFKAGHRIWVKIAGQDPGYVNESAFDPVVAGEGPIPARISVYHDTEHPSHLLLPVIPDAPEIAPVEPPLADIYRGGPTVEGDLMASMNLM